MPVLFQNFEYQYWKGKKPYFAPNDRGKRIGIDIKRQVELAYTFDDFVYHLRQGGHIGALHKHRPHAFFAKADIKLFFYSISRSKVQRALKGIGIPRPEHYAKWSCVKNPFGEPNYALPYGFVQSPILATVVLLESVVGTLLRQLYNTPDLAISLYMDDIALSSDDEKLLDDSHRRLLAALNEANYELSPEKTCPPTYTLELFNCHMTTGATVVMQTRIDKFLERPRSAAAVQEFGRYLASVEEGNA